MATQYNQTDWIGEEPAQHSLDHGDGLCPICGTLVLNFMFVGCPSVYCSDAHKMKAYRQRKKALRNAQHQKAVLAQNFDVKKGVFNDDDDDRLGEEEEEAKTQSVGSDCNTHTKVRNPELNDKNNLAFTVDLQPLDLEEPANDSMDHGCSICGEVTSAFYPVSENFSFGFCGGFCFIQKSEKVAQGVHTITSTPLHHSENF